MSRRILVAVALVVVISACGGASPNDGVASLETPTTSVDISDSADRVGEELFGFAACMRDNGVDDFRDPIVGADGKVEFPDKASSENDKTVFASAYAACSSFLEGTTLGGEKSGPESAAQLDALYEFAGCLRDQGIDVSDPDPVTGDISDIDKDDPDFDAAYEACGSALSTTKAP